MYISTKLGLIFVFYDKYIDLCKKSGVKPTPVAVSLGLSSSNVAQWKKGSTPRPSVLQKIADYFDVKVSYFFETSEEKKEKPPAQGGEPLDPVTRELMEFVETASDDERQAALEMVKLIKKQRGTQNG